MKDQYVIACVESPEGAELLIPWARHYAQSLNGKGLMLLNVTKVECRASSLAMPRSSNVTEGNVSRDGDSDWLKQYGLPYAGLRGDWKTVIDGLPTAFGGILAITAVDPSAPRSSITNPRTLLRQFRDCKIAYLVVNSPFTSHLSPFTLLTLDHRRESKEKLIWASYLVRFLGAKLTVALPDYRDGGLKAHQTNNLRYLEKIAPSLGLTYTTATIPAPTLTPPDVVAVETLQPDLVLALATDRRDRDVGDWLLGDPELKLLRSGTPTLLLNQRDDLYVLCD
jgi:hypothetical protein